MTTTIPEQPTQAITARYLQSLLESRLPPAALKWLQEKCDQVRHGTSPSVLYTAFSAASRMVGKNPLEPEKAELEEAKSVRKLWKPDDWTIDQTARCLLLLNCHAFDIDGYVSTIEKLFSTADTRELVALYQALPLLPYQDRYRARAAEGVRSNMVNVFHAIALNNPYPFERFDESAWNQMVLKVVFIGSPMEKIIGLEARINPTLARMLGDLVHERRAAGRSFPAQVWPLMAPYADAEMIGDLRQALEDEEESQRTAAIQALAEIGILEQ